MEYIKANREYAKRIFELVQNTISAIYPRYYPTEVVDFFRSLHNRENIVKDIENGNTKILINDNILVGTGSYKDNHITRVYVLPEFQNKGYGSFIMQQLENEISLKYNTINIDASLPASIMYEHRGYKTIRHEKFECKNGAMLVYEIMEKRIDNEPKHKSNN